MGMIHEGVGLTNLNLIWTGALDVCYFFCGRARGKDSLQISDRKQDLQDLQTSYLSTIHKM